MNCTKIQQALYAIAAERELAIIVTPSLDATTAIEKLPALWFAPLKIVEVEGRNSGRIEYELNLGLIYPSKNYSSENKIDTSAQMEEEILSMLTELSLTEPIIIIDEIEVELALEPLTKHNDLTLIASANITTYFGY